ncbi:MAG: hypothetical protein FWC93_02705 [Defluviitaleaceae bacterium]|nr:hypothetical protein [Defluviitaleaceae bacterium]
MKRSTAKRIVSLLLVFIMTFVATTWVAFGSGQAETIENGYYISIEIYGVTKKAQGDLVIYLDGNQLIQQDCGLYMHTPQGAM